MRAARTEERYLLVLYLHHTSSSLPFSEFCRNTIGVSNDYIQNSQASLLYLGLISTPVFHEQFEQPFECISTDMSCAAVCDEVEEIFSQLIRG